MTKFKVPGSGGATAASEAVGSGEATVSGVAVGPAGLTPGDGCPASPARQGDCEEPSPQGPLSAAAPAGPSSLEVVFADLAAAHAVLAEHSLSRLLSDGERASVIAARVRVDEVLAGLAAAVG